MAASQAVAAPGVVLDTNAVLDGWLFADPAMQPLRQAIEAGRVVWLASTRMRQELQHTLAKPQLAGRLGGSECPLAALDAWSQRCPEPASPAAHWPRCTDATDQVFVDLALAQRARWLVSHDRAVRKLARRAAALGLWIGPPAQWPGLAP